MATVFVPSLPVGIIRSDEIRFGLPEVSCLQRLQPACASQKAVAKASPRTFTAVLEMPARLCAAAGRVAWNTIILDMAQNITYKR